MSQSTRLGLGILAVGLVLGLLGHALLQAEPWGINVGLWVALLVLATVGLVRWGRLSSTRVGFGLGVAAAGFAAAVAWRDSVTLVLLDILAVMVTLGLATIYGRVRSAPPAPAEDAAAASDSAAVVRPPAAGLPGPLWQGGVADYALSLFWAGVVALLGPLPLLVSDIRWGEIPKGERTRQTLAVLRGLLLALPLLLVFGSLFAAADAVFAQYLSDLLGWDPAELVEDLVPIAFCAWVVSGLLRELLLAGDVPALRVGRPPGLRLGLTETATVLGLLNLLFLAFVLVQFRYFFGGADLVQASTGLTYAEYARRGFFELVTVTALVLPLLLLAHWLLPEENPQEHRHFRTLAGTLVLLLLVIMVSALQRMRLYVQEYGLTELRLYTTAFMLWLAGLFAWFVATVLRGRRERFAFGVLVSGLAAIAVLHLVNPDALIVRTNLTREASADSLDVEYLSTLSGDAVPGLLQALPQLPPEQACLVAERLRDRWVEPAGVDWRTWNWSRSRAQQAVARASAALKQMPCP